MATATAIHGPILRVGAGQSWAHVLQPETGLLIEEREPLACSVLEAALASLERSLTADGAIADLPARLTGLPLPLAADIVRLASRFAALMGTADIRLRLERIETNACRKWHIDYTDLRLVVTYAGPGTQFRLDEDDPIEQVATSAVALFKGHDFGPGHTLIRHRSPPVAGTGVQRLVLVIDTPAKPRDLEFFELSR